MTCNEESVGQSPMSSAERDAENYFRQRLADVEEPTAPFGLIEAHSDGTRLENRQLLESELASSIRDRARQLGTNPVTLFYAAWALVLAHTTGREDVVFGSVLPGRSQTDAQTRPLGMFSNTLPLRIRLQDPTTREPVTAGALLELTRLELAALLTHEHASLALAQRCSGLAGSVQLFSTLLHYRHPESQWRGARGITVLSSQTRTHYPITVWVDDFGQDFQLTVQTVRSLDPQRVVRYLHAVLDSLVSALDRAPQTPARLLNILPTDERQQLLGSFGALETNYPQDLSIPEWFERQVQRNPDAVAVSHAEHSVTYATLNARANQLAHHLRAQGVGPDKIVGLCMERSLELVVGLLGILKAGGAYLPLDPTYPLDRLAYMVTDAAPRVVLIAERLRNLLPEGLCEIIALDGQATHIAQYPGVDIEPRTRGLRPDHLAYVIYTSGSTGAPKGVMVEHRNVTRLFAATQSRFDFGPRDVWTLFHSYAFDFSVWELWGALFHGGRAVVVPQLTTRSPLEFYRLLCEEGVTVLNQTPSAFTQLIRAQEGSESRSHSLRVAIFGGEALELHTLQPWVARNGAERPQLVNMYGITETTVHVTYRRLTAAEIASERNSVIGNPLPDLKIHLLDSSRQPVPVGVPGELYVGGAGLARGYLNRPELTAERFIRDPYSADPNSRLYKTGDLGRWRADGSLEYLGRNDSQVKIRGFRIELGEIEAKLLQYEDVTEAVVLARQDEPGEKRLVAYVIARNNSSGVSAERLRAHLEAVLPEHMVPSAFVQLQSFPLTPNGKLDRKNLPAPQLSAYARKAYEAPQGEVEELLAGIWQTLLKVERVGRQDNFFDLGGHSVQAMQVLARLRTTLSIDAPMSLLFRLRTLQALSAEVSALSKARSLPGDRAVSDQTGDKQTFEALLSQVAALPEAQAREWLRELRGRVPV